MNESKDFEQEVSYNIESICDPEHWTDTLGGQTFQVSKHGSITLYIHASYPHIFIHILYIIYIYTHSFYNSTTLFQIFYSQYAKQFTKVTQQSIYQMGIFDPGKGNN